MKHLPFFVLFCLGANAHGQDSYRNPDIPLSNSIGTITFVHVVNSQKRNTHEVNIGEEIGTIEKYPDTLSTKFNNEIRLSENYYHKKDFVNAKKVLENAVMVEAKNPFILNSYARACYNVDRPTGFIVYKNLIAHLDSLNRSSDSVTIVDIWFREAYWKLGTLYMDSKEWNKAYFEISRFLLAIGDLKGQGIYIQAIEYLTECAFMTSDDKLASYLANRLLLYDSHNEYAHEVLTKMKRKGY